MSDPGRQQFLWPQPGEPRGGDDSIFRPGAFDARTAGAAACCSAAAAAAASRGNFAEGQAARAQQQPSPTRQPSVCWPPACLHADPPTAQDPVLDTFCLVCLEVEEVDHIQLNGNLRHVYLLQPAAAAAAGEAAAAEGAAAEWAVRNVNP